MSGAAKYYERIKLGNMIGSRSREESVYAKTWRKSIASRRKSTVKALSQEYFWCVRGGKQPRGCSILKRVHPEERLKKQTERSP